MTKEEFIIIQNRLSKTSKGIWIPYIEGRDFTSGSSCIVVQEEGVEKNTIDLSGATDNDIEFIAHAKQDIALLLKEINILKGIL